MEDRTPADVAQDEAFPDLERASLEQSTDGLFIADLEGRLLTVNPSWLEMHGFAHDDGTTVRGRLYEEFRAAGDGVTLLDRLRDARSCHEQVMHLRPDGSRFPASVQASLILDAAGKPVAFSGSIRDVSARLRIERFHEGQRRVLELLGTGRPLAEVLEALVETLEVVCSGTLGSVLLVEPDGGTLTHGAAPSLPDAYNRAVDGISIGPTQGSCGTAAFRRRPVIVTDIDTDPLWAQYRDLARKHGLRACWSHPIVSPEGAVLGTFAMYYREPRGPREADLQLIEAAAYLAGVAIRRERVERELRDSEERYRVLVENAPEAVVLFNVQQRCFVDVNENAVKLLERSRHELLRMGPADISAPRQHDGRPTAEVAEEQIAQVLAGNRLVFEWLFELPSGRRMACEVRLVRLPYRGQDLIRASIIDVSARKRVEELRRRQHELVETELERLSEQLVRRTRLAAVGQVAASIAHELRNPLGAIGNAVFYLKRHAARPGPKWTEYLEIIAHEIRRADRIVTNLLEMSRERKPLKQAVDLREVVRHAWSRVEHQGDPRLDIDLEPEPFMVQADPDQLGQVLQNLLTNAVQAIGGRGRVRVEGRVDGSWHELIVRDSGAGIAPEARQDLFEPLFTTKAQGTGLGLSICRQIVQQHGGSIDLLADETGEGGVANCPGAAFRVRLPQRDSNRG